jgi:hypothetical protein
MTKNKPIVTFVVITYKEQWEPYMFIGMLKCMKNPNWKAIVWHDGPNPEMRAIFEAFGDERIQYIENEENKGSWGCYNRIDALQMVDTEFVVQCTVQEYYLPIFVDELIANSKFDMIYWPVVHHSFGYAILDPEPKRGKMDWSNFALRTHIARKVGIKYPDAYMADGLFVEDVIASGLAKSKIKLRKILNIKN